MVVDNSASHELQFGLPFSDLRDLRNTRAVGSVPIRRGLAEAEVRCLNTLGRENRGMMMDQLSSRKRG